MSNNNNDNNQPTFTDALQTIKVDDFKNVGKIPCARNALLYGMGGAFGAGGIRYIVKRTVPSAANWAVAAFCGISLISFEMCQMDRKAKLERLHLIVKETNSRGGKRQVVDEQGKNGAFHVVVDTSENDKKE
ncbi:hypothetical protein BDB00DRAFT_850756 [Zychaea mexicana]|uniref:uncharacterized protein n=1 Tax=Zychaea mexicana TaxID=64656 RepID=UPI0022FDB7EB|nr:uncharacterized protein BDB00DRAFT_850756 [Zychaea mexicana]KAI9487951.1 hypothetical protein BDB00DRAFT_850756 [Zychaea mexicana]